MSQLEFRFGNESDQRWPAWRPYVWAGGITSLCCLVRLGLDPIWHDAIPFGAFYLAVLLVAVCFEELGPALFTIGLSLVLGFWFFVEPRHSMYGGAGTWLEIAVFVVTSGVLLFFYRRGRRALERERAALGALRAKAEELNVSLELNRRVIESTVDGIHILDLGGRLLSINEAGRSACEIEDLSRYLSQPWSQLWPEAQRGVVSHALEAGRGGNTSRFCAHGASVKGAERWWEVVITPMRNRQGQPERLLAVVRDISESKRAERALLQAKEELESKVSLRTESLQKTTEELNSFCYSIAHDLRAPLRTQLGFAKILLEDFGPALGEAGRKYTRLVLQAAERQSHILQDLLAHVSVGRAELPMEPISLSDAVEQARADLGLAMKEKEAQFNVQELDGWRVRANRTSLHLIVLNLLSNAVKFMPPGRVPRVNLRAEPRDGFVRLWVEDNGIGIEPRHRDRLFRLFQRLNRASAYEGTGMGLAIVKKAAERMGGRVGVDSAPGQGSRFWVELESAENSSAPRQPAERRDPDIAAAAAS